MEDVSSLGCVLLGRVAGGKRDMTHGWKAQGWSLGMGCREGQRGPLAAEPAWGGRVP